MVDSRSSETGKLRRSILCPYSINVYLGSCCYSFSASSFCNMSCKRPTGRKSIFNEVILPKQLYLLTPYTRIGRNFEFRKRGEKYSIYNELRAEYYGIHSLICGINSMAFVCCIQRLSSLTFYICYSPEILPATRLKNCKIIHSKICSHYFDCKYLYFSQLCSCKFACVIS